MQEAPTHQSRDGNPGIRRLFDLAVLQPSEQRRRFLHESCGGDESLELNVLALLKAVDKDQPLEIEVEDHRIGTVIQSQGGGWELQEWLGKGGSGNVYRAAWTDGTNITEPRHAAIKILNKRASTPERVLGFHHEVEMIRRINHPGVVKVLDASFDHPGSKDLEIWIALELVHNAFWITEVMFDPCDQIPFWSNPTNEPSRTPMGLLLSACDIMGEIHKSGIVHRDLKPGNLLVDEFGKVHVIDFGIAKLTGFIHEATTNIGLRGKDEMAMGTPAYMAPEQVDASLGPISPRTDVHALGVIAYRMLSGRPPFEVGDNLLAAAQAIRHVPPADLRIFVPEIPDSVVAVIERSLEKLPERRPADAASFAAEMRRAIEMRDVVPPRRKMLLGRVAVAIFLGVIVFWSWIASSRPSINPLAIIVPDDLSTIQAAIDAVANGGVIRVRPGTYKETIDFGPGKNRHFVLTSTKGASVTTIDGSDKERSVVFVGNGFDDRTRIQGFTVIGGNTGNRSPDGFLVGGGIYLRLNSASVVDCRFIENRATFGGNMYAKNYSGSIHNCIFSGGRANAEGGNAFLFRGGSIISESRFYGGFTTGDGGGVKVASGCHSLVSCTITKNTSDRGGGIFYLEFDGEPSELKVIDSLVSANTAFDGGGILTRPSGEGPTIHRTRIRGNTPNEIVGPVSKRSLHADGYCRRDLDADGFVGAFELHLLMQHWGDADSLLEADFDGDGRIDVRDLAILLAQWGPCSK